MNKVDFLEKFVDVLQTEDDIDFDTKLEDIEEWDSLSMISTVAFLDKDFSIKVSIEEVKNFKTVGDIAKKAGL